VLLAEGSGRPAEPFGDLLPFEPFGVGSDEVYAVSFTVDLSEATPRSTSVRTGKFEDVDEGDSRTVGQRYWGIDGVGTPVVNRDDVITLVVPVEHDSSRIDPALTSFRGAMPGNLAAYLPAYRAGTMSRDVLISRLKADFKNALESALEANVDRGFLGTATRDDLIGDVKELRWTAEQLDRARTGSRQSQMIEFTGDGGRYQLHFGLDLAEVV